MTSGKRPIEGGRCVTTMTTCGSALTTIFVSLSLDTKALHPPVDGEE